MGMKIIVLGATGMLGHKVVQVLQKDHEVILWAIRDGFRWNDGVDVVINCCGVVKQRTWISKRQMVEINSLLPHKLLQICGDKTKLIHISTDCVFSGKKGEYTVNDTPDPHFR